MKHINKAKRKPCGPIENMSFDKTNLLQEVKSDNEDSTINYLKKPKKKKKKNLIKLARL